MVASRFFRMEGTPEATTPEAVTPEARVRAMVSALAGVVAEGVTEADRVAAVAALEELKGAAAAAQVRLTAAAVEDREALGEDSRSVRADLALARRCSPTLMDQHVGVAKALVSEMPHTLAALTAGEIGEYRARIMVRETACLSSEDRSEVDRLLADRLGSLGDRALTAAAQRAGAALDAASLAERNRRAVASRRVTLRPAPDGMAWLSILGPMVDAVGAYAALTAAESRRRVLDPSLSGAEWEAAADAARADTRGKGAWMADTALELLSGRASGQVQPVEVGLVMTDRTMLPAAFGGVVPEDDVAHVPGWGPVPGAQARAHVEDCLDRTGVDADDEAGVWLRRLFTDPTGHDLVALDSRRRLFDGGLRMFLQLRDPVCRVPWCDAPAVHADHVEPVHAGGTTSAANGGGACARHNLVKEHDGWHVQVTATGLDGAGPHTLRITTPTRRTYEATAPPILGEGWAAARAPAEHYADPDDGGRWTPVLDPDEPPPVPPDPHPPDEDLDPPLELWRYVDGIGDVA
ncbi:uncharacterized protein DUF222 [Knoellia remsis]|uniref:Uncharacterized protein DUF222 n=2 Tax=Knoellia remsis TaxID=407159 RepID=A0A2T0UQP0_9MICO|nr:uncharacterized protein DUF222 [Knoellia remsis]